MDFETVIGLEIHAELATNTKAFCACKVQFGDAANTHCCPVCMGLPGSLPTLNKKVVEFAVMMGLATNCKINKTSYMARKNYFYPDLPKGYQISQSEIPLCEKGCIELNGRKIRINRIHIEEDAGKLIHGENETKIDYNRAGVGLIEIVTEPDLRSSTEAREFFEKVREILLYLGISNAKMQEGNLRCDVNVSIRHDGDKGYNQRCEMKNINSFAAVERCIDFEEKRQKNIILSGGEVKRETRRWVDEKRESILMRDKESMADYRHFPEPDMKVIKLDESDLKYLMEKIPELPEEKRKRYMKDYLLSEDECNSIVKKKHFTQIFEDGIEAGGTPKEMYNQICEIKREANERGVEAEDINISPREIAELLKIIERGEISKNIGREVLRIMIDEGKSAEEVVKEKGFTQIDDRKTLLQVAQSVLLNNEKSVGDYKKGKTNAFGYLMGQCMKMTQNKANPNKMKEILKEEIEK